MYKQLRPDAAPVLESIPVSCFEQLQNRWERVRLSHAATGLGERGQAQKEKNVLSHVFV